MNNFTNYNQSMDNFTSGNSFNNMNQGNNFFDTNLNSMQNENFISMANNIDSLSLGSNYMGGNNSNMSNPYGNIGNMGNMGQSNLSNIANLNGLNGTSLSDLAGSSSSNGSNGSNGLSGYEDNGSLIKSLTKEIISNLKENNINLYDNLSKRDSDTDSESSSRKRKKKKDKSRTVKEEIQEYIEEKNPIPSTNNVLSDFFNDSNFSIKDFLILFTLYFLLSQEMIKDFFSKYFTSLNPDDEGKVGIQGVIIYGLILTVLFIGIKKLVNLAQI